MTPVAQMRPGTARDRAMVEAYLAGVPLKQIGHPQLVYRALSRAGITPLRRQCHPAWWQAAGESYAAGVSIAAIARQLGCERRPVQYALTKLGLR